MGKMAGLKQACCAAAAAVMLACGASGAENADKAVIAKWPENKKAVFLLQFDDGCPSHLKTAIPELKKRGLVGTFYINAGCGHCSGNIKAWEKDIPAANMVLGNHTFTHKGVQNAEELDKDLSQAQAVIDRIMKRKQPYLTAFGQPGGVAWKVSKDEVKAAFKKYNLVDRPSFFGPPIHLKKQADMLAYIDKTLAGGEMGHFDFHGTAGDWLEIGKDDFIAILDKLAGLKDQMWVTDMTSWHKYAEERKGAKVALAGEKKGEIKLKLDCATDAKLYDMPLTLSVAVPADWKGGTAVQKGKKTPLVIRDGRAEFAAAPVSGEIVLTAGK